MKNIFVGNLPFSASEEEVRRLFEQYGTVHSVNLINDRETGRPRGFGFVEMDDEDAESAIEGLNGVDLRGRNLQVNEARERSQRGGGGGGGYQRREGGGGGGGYKSREGGYSRREGGGGGGGGYQERSWENRRRP